jgi:hypothetical protein
MAGTFATPSTWRLAEAIAHLSGSVAQRMGMAARAAVEPPPQPWPSSSALYQRLLR